MKEEDFYEKSQAWSMILVKRSILSENLRSDRHTSVAIDDCLSFHTDKSIEEVEILEMNEPGKKPSEDRQTIMILTGVKKMKDQEEIGQEDETHEQAIE